MAALPLDIRVEYQPERGFTVTVEGQEVSTAGMGNSAILWNVVLYLVERLPDNGRVEELQMAALHMNEIFGRWSSVHNPGRRQEDDLFLHQQMMECPAPEDATEECCICQDNEPGEQWVRLRACGHMFHSHCISAWANPTCPLCRGDLTRNTRQRRR